MDKRIKQLAISGEVLFRDKDLAVLWQMTNSNTLYTTINRYVKKGILEKIKSGIYSLKKSNSVNIDMLGVKILHKYCYVSTETILEREGVIKQKIHRITYVSSLSKKFSLDTNHFLTRQMKDVFLHNNIGIYTRDGVNYASVERAVADLLYFNPTYYIDGNISIDWSSVEKIRRIVGYQNT